MKDRKDAICRPAHNVRELQAYPGSEQEIAATGPFGDLPVLIISGDPDVWGDDWISSPELRQKWAAAWNELNEDLKRSRRDRGESSRSTVTTAFPGNGGNS